MTAMLHWNRCRLGGILFWMIFLIVKSLFSVCVASKRPVFWSLNNSNSSNNNNNNNNITSTLWIRKFAAVSREDNPRILNVHLVPHSHDDVGWRKTVEQYFYNDRNSSIDRRGNVESIYNTVLQSLMAHESHTFVATETKFYSMWWNQLSDAVRDTVRYDVQNGQWQFVNGGWCMHDEATTHYMGMVDQTTLGHAYLRETVNVVPTTAWQLDPFGHSATQATLMTAQTGMNAIYFGRIDYQDLGQRQLQKTCEGFWQPNSHSKNDSRRTIDTTTAMTTTTMTVFWGLTGSYGGNYGAPDGFCLDLLCRDEKLLGANHTRLRQRIDTFLQLVRIQADRTVGNHVMLTMGTDFNYAEAQVNYANMDLLISTVMSWQDGIGGESLDIPTLFGPTYDRVNFFYSTPDYYTQMKYNDLVTQRQKQQNQQQSTKPQVEPISYTTKKDDFFPYSDSPNSFWTGYFTSRPSLKRFERYASAFLMAARQIHVLPTAKANALENSRCDDQRNHPNCISSKTFVESSPVFPLEDALGIVQHHDAVSGTAKQHVADDYSFKIQTGLDIVSSNVADILREYILDPNDDAVLSNFQWCHRLNETTCFVSENATKSTAMFVVVYNSLAQRRSAHVRLPVAFNDTLYVVERVQEEHILPQQRKIYRSIPVSYTTKEVNTIPSCDHDKFVVVFDTGILPAVGAATFRIVPTDADNEHSKDLSERNSSNLSKVQRHRSRKRRRLGGTNDVEISNGVVSIVVDAVTGVLKQMVGADGRAVNLTQTWGYYTSFDSTLDHYDIPTSSAMQNSGAYIFRPSTPTQKLQVLMPSIGKIVETNLGTEIHTSFEEGWVQQVTRILNGRDYVDVEYTVGPIPIEDGRGKEIVTRYTSTIQSQSIFYADSNGRDFMQRQRNFRPTWNLAVYEPVAGNYYPVNAALFVQDSESALAIVVDRSQGGASLIDGSLEFMVHRRTVVDDHRGVDEPINETCGGMSPYPPYGKAERIGHGVVIRGTHRIKVGQGPTGASLARSAMDDVFAEPLVFVGSSPVNRTINFHRGSFSGLASELPANVMLMTLTRLGGRPNPTFLVRVGHQYGADEDSIRSAPAEIDLAMLFASYTVTSVQEMTLSANQMLSTYMRSRYNWTDSYSSPCKDRSDTIIKLQSLEIRTFEVGVVPLTTTGS